MSDQSEGLPNYRGTVPEHEWLQHTRAGISSRSADLLAVHRPDLVAVRFSVPDQAVGWDKAFPDYAPPFIDEPYGRHTGKDLDEVDDSLVPGHGSREGAIRFDSGGYPLNPIGRTGLRGRLTMNKFGPTKAADAIVVRGIGDDAEVLIVERMDNGLLALPAGKLNLGEGARGAAGRETFEETSLEFDFTHARAIFSGMVDDDRATDNAWFETEAFLLRASGAEAARQPKGKDDAAEARWLPLAEARSRPSHASTAIMLELAYLALAERAV
jgi:ADP-ribose pyrophosphatase